MSRTIIRKTWDVDNILTDVTSMTIEIKRTDNDAVVVAAGTEMTHVTDGTYEIDFVDPASGLTYAYTLIVLHDGHTHTDTGTAQGGSDNATTSLYDLKKYIVPEVGGVSDPLLEQTIRRVFSDFCRATGAWEEELSITTVADQASYDIPLITGTTVTDVIDARHAVSGWQIDLRVARDGKTVVFEHIPRTSGDAITLTALLLPTPACATGPTWILDQYGYGIACGVVAWLKGEAGKPWTDIGSFQLWDSRFRDVVSQAKLDRFNNRSAQVGMMRLPDCL